MTQGVTSLRPSLVGAYDRNLRDTGIPAIGMVSWGTHMCQLFRTKRDLIETLVPFNQAGLAGGELCLWVTYAPLDAAEAVAVMHEAVPDFDDAMRYGQIEIAAHNAWYGHGQEMTFDWVLAGLIGKYRQARSAGYYGLRVTGNGSWLNRKQWNGFREYEAAVQRIIGKYPMICLCSYSLDECGPDQIRDILANHHFVIKKDHDDWVLMHP